MLGWVVSGPKPSAAEPPNRAPHEEPPEQQRADAQVDRVQEDQLAVGRQQWPEQQRRDHDRYRQPLAPPDESARLDRESLDLWTGIPQIKPTFLDIAPSGIPSNIIPHSKGVKCGLIRSNSPFSYSNHRPAKPKIPKPLVYAQVSPLGTSFATP